MRALSAAGQGGEGRVVSRAGVGRGRVGLDKRVFYFSHMGAVEYLIQLVQTM